MYARDRIVPRPRRESPRLLSSGAPLETFTGDRRCGRESCGVRLSRYNPSVTCSVHRGWADTASRSYG